MRILVMGGTGAMGVHLTRLLATAGHEIVVTSRRTRSSCGGIRYIRGDAKDPTFLGQLLTERWGAIVDFMVWSTPEFQERHQRFLASTDQYIFISSYRVYADSPVITEDSLRLLDAIDDPEYLATDEYALAKARCEDMLFQSSWSNWTIIRPAVTYDGSGRFQLGVHESELWLWRAIRGIPVPLPGDMLGRQATMTWGRDVARMIAGLVRNPYALCEAFTASTAEHIPWSMVVEVYRAIVPRLEVLPCDLTRFERERGGVYQIRYDRMYNRIIDNSKIIAVTGIDRCSLAPIHERLASELAVFLRDGSVRCEGAGAQAHMDRLVGGCPSFDGVVGEFGAVGAAKYLVRRFLS